jgi:hypothetical protein
MVSALKDAAENFHQAYSTVRDIYYVSCAGRPSTPNSFRFDGALPIFDDCGLCGIDLDTCRDIETGLYTPWAQEILDYFGEDYAELSPSATGVKLFFAYRLNEIAALRAALGISPGGWSAAYKNGAGGKQEHVHMFVEIPPDLPAIKWTPD